jgi:hypothetical protein
MSLEALHYGKIAEQTLGSSLEPMACENGIRSAWLWSGMEFEGVEEDQVGDSMRVMASRGVLLLERETL